MSLPLETTPVTAIPAVRYRALCPSAVVSIVVGALSILSAVHWSLAIVPMVGIGLGWRAAQRIRRAPDEWTGLGLARLGIGLSVGLWIIGYGWLIFARASEVPYGYERVSYEMLQPDPNAPAEPIPQSALDMQDKRVFIKGYMKPVRRQTGIKEFTLCPSNGECPFCIPNPKRTEMIRVVLQGDLETIYTTHLVGVGGRFQVDAGNPSGVPYSLDADFLR
jgi:hypothetical protein